MAVCKHLGLAVLLAVSSPAYSEDLVAVSNTATSITGDIFMDDFEIVFADGQALAFDELVSDTFVVDGAVVNASVYSVLDPADPVLLNGNRLCGSGRVTYVASWGGADPDTVVVAVFDTEDVPGGAEEMCASYLYEYAE